MSNSRDSSLENEVATLERELAAFKAGQISSSDVIAVHESITANSVDFQMTSPTYADQIRWVKFVAANQDSPLVRVLCDVKYNGSGLYPTDNTVIITYAQVPDRPAGEIVVRLEAVIPPDDRWGSSPPPPTGTMNFKVYVNATDTGVTTVHTSLP